MSASDAAAPGDGTTEKKGPVDLFLSLFADVRPGEGVTALILLSNVMLLLLAYYVLKTVREPLIIASGGAQLKAYATATQAVLLSGFVPLYSALVQRLDRMKLITATMVFYAAGFSLFWVLAQLGVPYLGFAFFLFLGIFSLSVVAQFWSLANDLYTAEQGKRLFAILGIGASVGAWAGSYAAKLMVKPLGPYPMMLVAAGLLLVCLALSRAANAREERRRAARPKEVEQPIGKKNGFALILGDKYLLLIAALILLLNVVNTNGELILDINLEAAAKASVPDFAALGADQQRKVVEGFVGEFRGDMFTWVNAVGAITQVFLVSRIFKYLGLRVALLVIPCISLFAYGVMAFYPVLALIRVGKIAENACDYSLNNTTKQALWLPTSREQKYNAKMAIDTFIVRAGDLVSGLVVAVGIGAGMTGPAFAGLNLAVVGLWLGVAVLIGRENARRAPA